MRLQIQTFGDNACCRGSQGVNWSAEDLGVVARRPLLPIWGGTCAVRGCDGWQARAKLGIESRTGNSWPAKAQFGASCDDAEPDREVGRSLSSLDLGREGGVECAAAEVGADRSPRAETDDLEQLLDGQNGIVAANVDHHRRMA